MSTAAADKTVWLQVKGKDGQMYKMQVHANTIQTVQHDPVVVKMEEEETVVQCSQCSKEFYNERALHNHLKLQHAVDMDDLPSKATDTPSVFYKPAPWNDVKIGGQKSGHVLQLDKEQLVSLASEDVDYIIVKSEDVIDRSTKSRTELKGRRIGKTSSKASAVKKEPRKRTMGAAKPGGRGDIKIGGKRAGRVLQLDKEQLVNLASEDVDYIIVKSDDVVSGKRKRAEPKARRAPRSPVAPAPPINVMGPFECLQKFVDGPDAVCHQVFFNCCEYSMHFYREHTRHRKPGVRCQVCEKNLDAQLAGVTDEGAELQCTQCRLKCEDADTLSEHVRVAHAKPRPFRCGQCHKGFTQHGGLQQHMRLHSGDRPFSCAYCDKTFTQKSGLGQHIRIHTKDRPFRCVVCNKSFCQSIHLKQHMRTHTHIAPYQCLICKRRFKQGSQLNQHLQSHKNYKKGESAKASKETAQLHYIVDDGETVEGSLEGAGHRVYIERVVDGQETGEYYTVESMDGSELDISRMADGEHVYTSDQVIVAENVETVKG